MNIYDIMSVILTIVIMCVCACVTITIMYACIMRMVHNVRMHDQAVCVRTHGTVVRDAAYMARCEEVVLALFMEDMDTTV